MDAVKTYVREMGGGLVMIGGEQSFRLGGYYRTPIEDSLPVKMPIKKNVEKPNLALALVIDKSGSMSGHKIELAKEAAIAAAEVLKENDRFGVVAFDGAAEWIAPMTDSSDLGAITGYISRLVAGGGTNIYPGLYDAFQALQEEDAKLEHIILLSDGQTEGSGYDTLVSHIAADGITLSTVGIGEGADMRLMEDMASWGNGESYFTNDFGSIPQIFTRETMRASKSMLIEEPFVPTQVAQSEILKGIPLDDMPFLLGYVGCQGKDRATISLVSDYGDPVLASWTFGLGRAVAFTSDAKARARGAAHRAGPVPGDVSDRALWRGVPGAAREQSGRRSRRAACIRHHGVLQPRAPHGGAGRRAPGADRALDRGRRLAGPSSHLELRGPARADAEGHVVVVAGHRGDPGTEAPGTE
jgi:Ca-activated chloride channel family protein